MMHRIILRKRAESVEEIVEQGAQQRRLHFVELKLRYSAPPTELHRCPTRELVMILDLSLLFGDKSKIIKSRDTRSLSCRAER